ncbi:MAG: hypothetical protein H6714_11570, partial [Myxococcales bacterium]|nr:hypothetical protein [Myxococcales bacterium]
MRHLCKTPHRNGTIHWSAVVLSGLLSTAALSVMATSAQAQTVNINHFRPAELARDGFAISRPDDQGHLKFGAQLHLEYANDPLVYLNNTANNNSEAFSVIEHQLVSHLTLSLGLWDRLVLFAGLPVNLIMDEGSNAFGVTADGPGIGDVYAGARLRLVGERDDVGALALQVTGTFPTADLADDNQLFSGDDSPMVHPELLMELRAKGVRLTGNVGARFREARPLPGISVDDELTYGAALTLPLVRDRLDMMGELWGSTALNDDFGKRGNSPLEALGGLKYYSAGGFTVGAAGGGGILGGYGAPDFRVMAMLGLGKPLEKEAPEEPAQADRDGDGIMDDQDQCPDDAEDLDGYEDEDGCPEPDNDKDGVLDVNDSCPTQPED